MESEVIVMNALTVNLNLLMVSNSLNSKLDVVGTPKKPGCNGILSPV